MLLPLTLGVLCEFLYAYWLKVPFNVIEGVKIGGLAITLYGFLEKLLKGVKSTETVASEVLVQEITKDGKVNKDDINAVKDYYKKLDEIK